MAFGPIIVRLGPLPVLDFLRQRIPIRLRQERLATRLRLVGRGNAFLAHEMRLDRAGAIPRALAQEAATPSLMASFAAWPSRSASSQ
ncbi:MAG: hypothetical protein IPG56_03065 [Caulobacteraceae bacterium]|nr:hypothetical protein [Caulobacteraceae bacterium]